MFRSEEITSAEILEFIQEHQAENARYKRLEEYYKGNNDILKRILKDVNRPNNKISHPFGTYITDLLTGYFMGEPVAYNVDSEEDIAFKELKTVLNYNIEHDENTELERNASIFGKAYEVLYIADDGNLEFKSIKPYEVFLIYDNTIQAKVNYAVRYVEIKDGYIIELYTKDEIIGYETDGLFRQLTLTSTVSHDFGDVPIIKYPNNSYEIGDFEKVIPLIDAYDKFVSDSLNDFDYFTNAYLAFYGVDSPEEDIAEMKQERLLFFPEGANAEFITKDLHGSEVEAHLDRTEKDIHKLSKVPNSSDENFASNASGVAMQYKLLGTENLAIVKERKFKRALQKRIELILNFLDFKSGNTLDWRQVNLTFTRNLPVDGTAVAEYINKLRGLLSDETLIGWLPNVEDAKTEIEKRDNEKPEETDTYSFGE